MTRLTHLDAEGRARMVDVGDKPETARMAIAEGRLICSAEALAMAIEDRAPKGAVITAAELAGIMAAKRTGDLIPLCHPLPLTRVAVAITADPVLPGFRIRAEAAVTARTGVEMEALTAVSVACLTLYDMLKSVDRAMRIEDVRLLAKSGGRSGDFPPAASAS